MMRMQVAAMAVLSLLPTPVRADGPYTPSPLTPSQLLQRAKAAVGEDAGGIFTVVTHTHSGGLDLVRTTFMNGDDSISHTTGGPSLTASGTHAGQDWSQDANGIVTLETGFADRGDPIERALAHPDDPASHVTVLGLTAGAPQQIALDVNPVGGEHEIRYYDATTYLLSKIERWGKDLLRHVSTYDAYRTVFGRTLAFHRSYTDGHPENDVDTRTVSYDVAKPPFPSTEIPPSRPLFSFVSNAPIVLPARFVDGHIVVRATIAGRGLDFLLDSGSTDIVINPAVAHDLGLVAYDKRSGVMGGTYSSALTVIPKIQLGGATLNHLVADESDVTEHLEGVKIVGLLGYDVIASGFFGIDFKKETVTLYPPGSAPIDASLARVPIESDEGVPRVSAWMEGVQGHFLLDTGSDTTILFRPYLAKLKGVDRLPDGYELDMVGGTVQAASYDVHDVVFGGIRFKNAGVLVPQTSTAELGAYDGLIGRDMIQNYIIFFDYANHALYLKPNL